VINPDRPGSKLEEEKMKQLNLWASSHKNTPDQGVEGGFMYLPEDLQGALNQCPSEVGELEHLGRVLLAYASGQEVEGGYDSVCLYQPGGSPAFQFILGQLALRSRVSVAYAHSTRESVEEVLPDGGIKKVAVFRHKSWIFV
jgi:hypothetical protein